jgi:adenosine deaminase
VARDLVRRLRRERIVHAEVYVSPAVVERIGLPWLEVRDAVEAVLARHELRGGGRVTVLLDSVRQWGPDAAMRVLDLHEALPWPRARGFGLGGEEASVPAREFAAVYRRVRRLGLAPLVHAGEWAGPDSVAEALRWLSPVRLAHGFRAAEDGALVRRLAGKGVALDLCLSSNEATGAVASGKHPALALLRAGVPVSLSTDDPGLFGATLRSEFARLARLGASAKELEAVRRTAFRKALAP